jgi:hypothetical protein
VLGQIDPSIDQYSHAGGGSDDARKKKVDERTIIIGTSGGLAILHTSSYVITFPGIASVMNDETKRGQRPSSPWRFAKVSTTIWEERCNCRRERELQDES